MKKIRLENAFWQVSIVALLLSGAAASLSAETRDGSAPRALSKASSEPIQFRGLMQLDGAWLFNLKDVDENVSFWAEKGQTIRNVEIKSYDAEANILIVGYLGQEHQLTLSQSNSTPLPVAQSRTIAGPGLSSIELPPVPQKRPPAPPNGGFPPDSLPPRDTPTLPQ